MPGKQTQLLRADDALIRYLDSLLREIPDTAADEASDPLAGPVPLPVQEPPDREPVRAPERRAGNDRAPQPETRTGGEVAVRSAPFKGLLFDVGGVTLVAPLDRLAGIVEWDGELNTVPGTPPHVLGLLSHQGRNVRVVDTGCLIGGEGEATRESPAAGYVVLLDDSDYGLACDQVREMIEVDPLEVRWRRGGVRRLWFAGILSEHMCALLDIDELTRYLSLSG